MNISKDYENIKKYLKNYSYNLNQINIEIDDFNDPIELEYEILHIKPYIKLMFNDNSDIYYIRFIPKIFIIPPQEKNNFLINMLKNPNDGKVNFLYPSNLPINLSHLIIKKNNESIDIIHHEEVFTILITNTNFQNIIKQWFDIKIDICWNFARNNPNATYQKAQQLKTLLKL